ncbi:MAG: AAA family ATPase [Fibromonadaceae bacterium]|nr:AAA family ATPase [Fibromonadaceae bacterium]
MNVNLNPAEKPAPSLWEQCFSAFLQRNPGSNDNSQGLSAIKHISAEGGVLSIEAPSELAKQWFLWRFQSVFLEIAASIDPEIKQISVLAPQIEEKILPPPELKAPKKLSKGNFHKKYKLSNFIAETSNELALKSAQFIAAMPRGQENFLLIKGASGLGKTHLLHAIASEASASWAKRAILWDADRFFKEKRKGNLSMLYQADILLFDDLQNLYNHESHQNDFLNILKNLKNKGCSIVIAINPKSKHQPATELADFLKMSIKCELKKPDLRTRIAILRQKAAEKGLPVAALENCWKLIAEKLGESVCSLEGAINELAAKQALLKCEITSQIALSIFGEQNTANKAPTIKSIANAAALAYQIPLETLCGKSRITQVNKPRQMAIYLCKQAGFSLGEIGKFFNRDVSSIVNAIQNIKNKLASAEGYAFEFELKGIFSTLSS